MTLGRGEHAGGGRWSGVRVDQAEGRPGTRTPSRGSCPVPGETAAEGEAPRLPPCPPGV